MEWIKGISPIEFPGLGLTLNPPAGFTIGSFEVRFYGVIIALGLILAVVYALNRKEQFGISEDDLMDGVLWIAAGAWCLHNEIPLHLSCMWFAVGVAVSILLHLCRRSWMARLLPSRVSPGSMRNTSSGFGKISCRSR